MLAKLRQDGLHRLVQVDPDAVLVLAAETLGPAYAHNIAERVALRLLLLLVGAMLAADPAAVEARLRAACLAASSGVAPRSAAS